MKVQKLFETLIQLINGGIIMTNDNVKIYKMGIDTWIAASAAGQAGILLSLMKGSSYMTDQSNNNSFLMALGLAVSLAVYTAGIYLSSASRDKMHSVKQ